MKKSFAFHNLMESFASQSKVFVLADAFLIVVNSFDIHYES